MDHARGEPFVFPQSLGELDKIREQMTPPMREVLWLKYRKACHWCGVATLLTSDLVPEQATIDHVIPRHRGGTDATSNLVSACRQCNSRRNKEDILGLPEGHLLGRFKTRDQIPGRNSKNVPPPLLPGQKSAHDVLKEQRDQALAEITRLNLLLAEQQALLSRATEERRNPTIWKLLRQRIAKLLVSE